MNPPQKACPKCQQQCPVNTPLCASCGHVYRTKFPEPPLDDRTQAISPPSYSPPPYQPNNYQSNNYQSPQPVYIVSGDTIQVPAGTHPVVLSILLSLLCLPGLATMTNRQMVKGIVIMLSAFAMAFIGVFTLFIPLAVVWIASIIDAISVANRLNRGEAIGQWTSF